MEKILRKRFVITSTFISFLILVVIITFVNLSNYKSLMNSNLKYLKDIVKNKNEVEFEEVNKFVKRFENIYIVDYNFDTNIIDKNCKAKRILVYSKNILNMPQNEGKYNTFKFYKDNESGKLYLINIKMTYNYFYSTMINSIIILLVAMIGVFLLSCLLSAYAIKPIIQNNDKQKNFITNATHEIKTPLAIIMSNIELLEYDVKENKSINSIKHAINRLNYLINDLLILARLDENEKTNFEEFDVSLLANEILINYENNIIQKKCNLKFSICENIILNANKEEYIKLFTILFDNMLKYSKNNSLLEFKLERINKKMIIETINETENLEKRSYDEIFERFTRLSKHRNKNVAGNGIGLSILSSIVEKYKGKRTAISDGKRMIIKISIPL